jgi:hypothetical protein
MAKLGYDAEDQRVVLTEIAERQAAEAPKYCEQGECQGKGVSE